MINKASLLLAVLALSGCLGGGGGSVSNISSIQTATPTPTVADESSINVRNHLSGMQIFVGDEIDETSNNQLRTYAAVVTNQSALDFILETFTDDTSQALNVTGDSFQARNDFGETRVVNFSIGTSNFSTTIYIDEQSDEAVNVNGISLSGIPNVTADGATLTSIPAGTFTYRGGLLHNSDRSSAFFSSGSFTMVANFDTGRAAFTGNTSTLNIAATNIAIDTNTGQFNSNNLTITCPLCIGIPDLTAQMDGSFTGDNASGVVGVYSSTGGEAVGGFAGVS